MRIRHVGFCLDYVDDLLGDGLETRRPLAITLIQSVLVIFSFTMVSDPVAIRDSRVRIIRGITAPLALLLGLEVRISEHLLRGSKCGKLPRLDDRGLHLPRKVRTPSICLL